MQCHTNEQYTYVLVTYTYIRMYVHAGGKFHEFEQLYIYITVKGNNDAEQIPMQIEEYAYVITEKYLQ